MGEEEITVVQLGCADGSAYLDGDHLAVRWFGEDYRLPLRGMDAAQVDVQVGECGAALVVTWCGPRIVLHGCIEEEARRFLAALDRVG